MNFPSPEEILVCVGATGLPTWLHPRKRLPTRPGSGCILSECDASLSAKKYTTEDPGRPESPGRLRRGEILLSQTKLLKCTCTVSMRCFLVSFTVTGIVRNSHPLPLRIWLRSMSPCIHTGCSFVMRIIADLHRCCQHCNARSAVLYWLRKRRRFP